MNFPSSKWISNWTSHVYSNNGCQIITSLIQIVTFQCYFCFNLIWWQLFVPKKIPSNQILQGSFLKLLKVDTCFVSKWKIFFSTTIVTNAQSKFFTSFVLISVTIFPSQHELHPNDFVSLQYDSFHGWWYFGNVACSTSNYYLTLTFPKWQFSKYSS